MAGAGIVVFLFGFWTKNYLAKYVGRKAENFATHEDIRMLVDQVRETEQAKAAVTGQVWNSQQMWMSKRDVYVELIDDLTDLKNNFMLALDLAALRRNS